MSKQWSPKAIWLGLAGAAAITAGVGYTAVRSLVSSTDKATLTGRIWIDHVPTKETEYFEVFVALEQSATGVFEKGSTFEGQFEVFRFSAKGNDKLTMSFPQRGKKYDVKYDAKECKEDVFDYCLSMSGAPRGAQKYLSRKGWEIEGGSVAEIQQKVEAWKQALQITEE